ncbi:MAG: PD-(D/E)XK nuclease family protein [Acutalibacteraceae bacterium]|nr:PD-(D/E)XK nuclease family protein [Acutalibacteraceae bacterium]
MLKFIFGRPASGKTYNVLNTVKKLAESGKNTVLIVPEQFSFESERAVLKTLGDKAALSVSVMSFSRLCDEVGRAVGGIAGVTLTEADKVIFMNRALSAAADRLKIWRRYCHSVFFAKTMLDTVGEFKINTVTAEDLKKASEETTGSSLSLKLHDIAVIYETYDTLTGEQFIDPADSLTKLYRQLENFRFFENKTVILDSFKGFTGQQFKIIDRILAQADDVVVSLTNDPALNSDYNVFMNIRAAAERIRKSAARFSVAEDKPLVLEKSRYNSKDMSALERLLAGGAFELPELSGDITICAAATHSDEAEFAARTIRRLVREKGYRYRDFVIIARDAEKYEESVYAACKLNGVPVFGDRREPLSAFPAAAAVNAALEFALRPASDSILRFHKTGLGTLSREEISALENYVYLWNIDGSKWQTDWTMDPRGFVSEDEGKGADKAALEKINSLREKAAAPLYAFKEKFRGTAEDMSRAVVELLESCNAAEKLAKLSERFKSEGAEFRSDVLKQSYDRYMKLLDSMAVCFGSREIKGQEFFEALSLSVSLDSVGVIPRMLDEVTFGAADRIRPSRPRVAFILGDNQGVFPKGLSNSGILGVTERKSLIELGIVIPDNQISSVVDENYLVYCNLCCPSDRLYISYATHSLTGEESEPSAFVAEIAENLGCKTVLEPQENLSGENLPETAASAYSQYCRRRRTADGETLKCALKGSREEEKLEYLSKMLSGAPQRLSKETAEKLFGKSITMSASRFDTFHKCRFSYFCRYGLSAKRIKPAEFDVLQRGTIVHFVLERIVGIYKKGVADLSENEINSLVDNYINEYLDGISGYRAVETERSRFLVSRISRALKAVVLQLSREFAQSGFEPVACELKIGNGGNIPELKIPFDKGDINIVGSIDRVDEYGGYIRVIDYKTGGKSFKLPDILFGLNLQMLIYLYAVVRAGVRDDEKAAGILYMPSKRDLSDNGMAMNGLIRSEKDIVSAMDRDMQGEFVPKYSITKSGALDKRCTSFVSKEDFSEIFDYIETLMKRTGDGILSGDIAVSPLDGRETPACKYCDYAAVCGRENAPCDKVPNYKNDEVINKIREEKTNGI